ncbi:hypothetical protein AB0J81_31565 [Streptomyces bobili]
MLVGVAGRVGHRDLHAVVSVAEDRGLAGDVALDRLAAAVLAELPDEWQNFEPPLPVGSRHGRAFHHPPKPQITTQPESNQLP